MPSQQLNELADWAEPLLAQLEPKARRHLTHTIARDLRRSQKARIAAQENPDGTPYAPRKPQHRAKAGAIRRQPMFMDIRKARYMKMKATKDGLSVGYSSHSGQALVRIARIHQFGLRANVDKDGPKYNYPARRLLGFTEADLATIRGHILNHIQSPAV